MRVRVIIIVLALIQGGDFFTTVEKVLKCTYISSALDVLYIVFYTICFNKSKKKKSVYSKSNPDPLQNIQDGTFIVFATFRGCMYSMAQGDGW